MEGGTLITELLKYFGYSADTASSSAFVQQRGKLAPEAFPALFDLFVSKTASNNFYKGLRLLAADGFKITEDTYETVATNLDPDIFPPAELKKLYAMRWGIETSFRELKYTIGLLYFHAKKVEHIYQEVFARLIMYNFTELITSPVILHKADCKYAYKANFTVAVHVADNSFLVMCLHPMSKLSFPGMFLPFAPVEADLEITPLNARLASSIE